jgi:hypothetical protein
MDDRIVGVSCHQCKSKKLNELLVHCTNIHRKKKDQIPCRKKYCGHCLDKFYPDNGYTLIDSEHFKLCPSCLGICSCAACKKKFDSTGESEFYSTSSRLRDREALAREKERERDRDRTYYPVTQEMNRDTRRSTRSGAVNSSASLSRISSGQSLYPSHHNRPTVTPNVNNNNNNEDTEGTTLFQSKPQQLLTKAQIQQLQFKEPTAMPDREPFQYQIAHQNLFQTPSYQPPQRQYYQPRYEIPQPQCLQQQTQYQRLPQIDLNDLQETVLDHYDCFTPLDEIHGINLSILNYISSDAAACLIHYTNFLFPFHQIEQFLTTANISQNINSSMTTLTETDSTMVLAEFNNGPKLRRENKDLIKSDDQGWFCYLCKQETTPFLQHAQNHLYYYLNSVSQDTQDLDHKNDTTSCRTCHLLFSTQDETTQHNLIFHPNELTTTTQEPTANESHQQLSINDQRDAGDDKFKMNDDNPKLKLERKRVLELNNALPTYTSLLATRGTFFTLPK